MRFHIRKVAFFGRCCRSAVSLSHHIGAASQAPQCTSTERSYSSRGFGKIFFVSVPSSFLICFKSTFLLQPKMPALFLAIVSPLHFSPLPPSNIDIASVVLCYCFPLLLFPLRLLTGSSLPGNLLSAVQTAVQSKNGEQQLVLPK